MKRQTLDPEIEALHNRQLTPEEVEEARQARPGGTALAGTWESPGDVKENKQTAAGYGEGTPHGSIRR